MTTEKKKQEMKLEIADNLIIDLLTVPYVTQGLRIFIAGISGAGKSYSEMKFLEEAHDARLQFCLFDVHGEGHVLSELSDNVVVASARFGIPVDIDAIGVYIDILESGMSLVLDLKSLYWGQREEFLKFTLQFLRKFMERWSNIMRPILLAVDEAQEITPQMQTKGISDLVKVVSEIVTGGRKSGVNILLASQRPAMISKTAISQSNVRLIGKMEDENDYNAVKPHLKYTVVEKHKNKKTGTLEEVEITKAFTFQEMKKLRSGEFIYSSEGEATKIHVNRRRTNDAGETPTIKTKFTTTQKKSMKEIADRIAAAIEVSKQERERETDLGEQVKNLEKQLKAKDEKIEKLELVEFVAKKIGISKVPGTVEVSPSPRVADIKAEIEHELQKHNSKMQKELEAKDVIIQQLETRNQERTKELEHDIKFKTMFREWLGQTGTNGSVNEDAIVARVMKQVGNGGTIYEVSPLDALTKDWEKKIHTSIVTIIDQLPADAKLVLSYLLVAGPKKKGPICLALWNNDGGGTYKKLNDALKTLTGQKLIVGNQNGYAPRIQKYIEDSMNGIIEDSKHIVEHVIDYVRETGVGQ